MPPTPGLAGVLAELAIMTSAASACAQQTEQLSVPNVTVTAPAIPIAPPTCAIRGRRTSEILTVVDIA